MKSPLIPHGAGKGDKARPVNKKTYDDNFNAIFRSPNRRKDKVSTPTQLPGGSEEVSTANACPTASPSNRYHRRLGPDGQTLFVVAH
jgi:hypothetical protein